MKTLHTQGEWDYTPENITKGTPKDGMYYRIGLKHREIARTSKIRDIVMSKEEESNAKLIAAAPELLEYLIACYVLIRDTKEFSPIEKQKTIQLFMNSVENVIKKATE